ncbi:hypothetical protein Tco_0047207 [Tanacetum coccineum]
MSDTMHRLIELHFNQSNKLQKKDGSFASRLSIVYGRIDKKRKQLQIGEDGCDHTDPTLDDLAVGTPSAKILAKAEASQKRKASTSGSTSSHVSKSTRSALAQSSGSTTRPGPFMDNFDNESDDDDDDACGSSAAQGPSTRDSRGKVIMVDDATASSVGGVARNCVFTREGWDAPYRPTFEVLTKEVFKDLIVCKTVVDQFPTPGEMVWVETLMINSRLKGYEDRVAGLTELELQVSSLKRQVSGLNDKLSSFFASFTKSKAKGKQRKKKIKSLTKSLDNLHAEVAHLSADLNQDTVLEAKKDEEILRLKATPLEFASFFHGHTGFECGLSMHQTKDEFAAVLKKMAHFVPGTQGRLAEASSLVAQTDYAFLNKISEHAAEPLYAILQLEPKKLARPANVLASRDACVSPLITKESIVTLASESLELPTNVVLASSTISSEQNEEWVNVMVDGPDLKITDGAAKAKSGRQQNTEQPEFNNEGKVDQNAEQCHDICPLPAKLTDDKTTELSNQSLESENIPKGHRFSIKKTTTVNVKTTTPRSCLRWQPTGRILKTVFLRWVPTGKTFASSTTKVESEPPNGSHADITNQFESKQALNVSAGTLLSTDQASVFIGMMSVHISSGLVLHQMTSDHNRSELKIQDHSNEPSSSKWFPKVVSSSSQTATSRQELGITIHQHKAMLEDNR